MAETAREFFDDLAANVEGARTAGMQAVLVRGPDFAMASPASSITTATRSCGRS